MNGIVDGLWLKFAANSIMIITIRTDEYIHCAVCNVHALKIFQFFLLCDTDTTKQQWMLICFINIENSMHNTDWMRNFAQNASNEVKCNSPQTCLTLSNSNGWNDQVIIRSRMLSAYSRISNSKRTYFIIVTYSVAFYA